MEKLIMVVMVSGSLFLSAYTVNMLGNNTDAIPRMVASIVK